MVTTSHADLDRLRLGDHFPAAQVLSLTHLFYLCEDCLEEQLRWLKIPTIAQHQQHQQQQQREGRRQAALPPPLSLDHLGPALHFLWQGEEHQTLTVALLRSCMGLVRARLFAALPRLEVIQANGTVVGLFHFRGTPTLEEGTVFSRADHPTEDAFRWEIEEAKRAMPKPPEPEKPQRPPPPPPSPPPAAAADLRHHLVNIDEDDVRQDEN